MARSEREHARHPLRTYLGWLTFYAIAIILLAVFFLKIAGELHTYNTPVGTVQLSIPYSKYLVGETISFAVTNNYNSAITVANNCPEEPLAVYKLVKSKWQRIHATAKISDCKNKSRFIEIPAKKTVTSNFTAWPSLFKTPGKYRAALFVEYFNSVSYQDFEVVKKPAMPKITKTQPSVSSPQLQTTIPNASQYENEANDEGEESGASSRSTSSSSPKQKTISVVGGGSITVRYSSNYITVLSVNPQSGCYREGGSSGTFVEVTFKCGETETQLQLWVSGGVLQKKIEQDD